MKPWKLAACGSLALCCMGHPSVLTAQLARGVVIDASTRTPVVAATVTLLDADAQELGSARSDRLGAFTIRAPVPARYIVTVRRLGFHGHTSAELVLGHRDTSLRVMLTPSPLPLPASLTRARRGLFAREWGRDGFIKRRDLGLGVFLTRLDVLTLEPEYLEEVFRNIEGLQVAGDGLNLQVRSLRGQQCLKVYVNRLPLPKPIRGAPQATGFELLPKHVLGIEVYREFKEVPEELRMEAHPCGLINVWTRAAWAPKPKKEAKPATAP